MLAHGGRGDFLAAADYDGNTDASDNWAHIDMPLNAVVYWSVQRTETHYLIGYDFYHPRDDAEIWVDRHENDLEGIMIAVPVSGEGFAQPTMMYTQAHGKLPFYYDEASLSMAAGSRYGGELLLDGDRPVVYITPNGTLDAAGHSVESGKGHSTYFYVGNSGVRYYHGGVAEEPATYKGDYTDNRCSYQLVSLDALYSYRNGPYTGSIFAEYGAFNGDDWEKNAANPPWGWRNKTEFGLSGTFLTDPAWTFARAISGLTDFS